MTDSSKLYKYQQVSLLYLKSREAEVMELVNNDTLGISMLLVESGSGGGKGMKCCRGRHSRGSTPA